MTDLTIERLSGFDPRPSLLHQMFVEPGTKEDWDQLHDLHYKSEGSPTGPKYWRCVLDNGYSTELVGVVILSNPKLILGPRHRAFPKLKPGRDTKITNVYRAKFINRHFYVNSRTVVDTLYRSTGCSYRMLNIAARMSGRKYIEIQSSMSRFNPFAQRAGFQFVRPATSDLYGKGLMFMGRFFDSHPSDIEEIIRELEEMSEHHRNKVIAEIKAFYYKHSALEKTGQNLNRGTDRVDAMPVRRVLKQLNQLVFAQPIYGVYTNPDAGRELPQRIALSAFDNQPYTDPLVL